MLFIISLVFFAAAMALMAVGVMLGNRPLTGDCGRSETCACEARK